MIKWRVVRDENGNAITLECDGEPVFHIYTTMLANQRADEIVRMLNDYERLRATLEKTVNCSTPTEPNRLPGREM